MTPSLHTENLARRSPSGSFFLWVDRKVNEQAVPQPASSWNDLESLTLASAAPHSPDQMSAARTNWCLLEVFKK